MNILFCCVKIENTNRSIILICYFINMQDTENQKNQLCLVLALKQPQPWSKLYINVNKNSNNVT